MQECRRFLQILVDVCMRGLQACQHSQSCVSCHACSLMQQSNDYPATNRKLESRDITDENMQDNLLVSRDRNAKAL